MMESLVIFNVLDSYITPVSIVDDYISLMYTKYCDDIGNFELVIPYSKSVLDSIQRNNETEKLILLDKDVFGVCHKVGVKNSQDEKSIYIEGTLSNGLLENYCVGKIERLKTATQSPQNLLNFPLSLRYLLNNLPQDLSGAFWAGIHYELPDDYQDVSWVLENGYVGGNCTFSSYIQNCIRLLNKSYEVKYNYNSNRFDLNLITPMNRTINQNTNPIVVLSTDFGDILSSNYYMNSKNYKNIVVAYTTVNNVYYQEIITYDNITSVYPIRKRRVAYQEITDINQYDTEGRELTESDIRGLLQQKGKEYLYDCALVSEYSCKLTQQNTFKYDEDYNLGDIITIQDRELDMTLDAKITGYTKTISKNGEVFEPIIGIPQPSLTRILKRKGVI